MGLLRRIFGPAADTPPPAVVKDGHIHAPDANPDEAVLPRETKSSAGHMAGRRPRGSTAASGGWSLGGGESPQGHHFGGGDSGGFSSSSD